MKKLLGGFMNLASDWVKGISKWRLAKVSFIGLHVVVILAFFVPWNHHRAYIASSAFADAPSGGGGGGDDGNSGSGDGGSGNGDTVNMSSGNFFYTVTDLKIPRPGIAINFTRCYSSRAGINGPIGFNWSHSYNMHLKFPLLGDNILKLTMEDGSLRNIVQNLDNTYSPEPRLYATFIKNGDGTYTMTFKDRTIWNFNSQGQIVSLRDRNNNQVTLNYSSGKLANVVDTTGHTALSFTYNVENFLSQMIDSAGRTYNYSYDGDGNLIGVNYPGGLSAIYTYGSVHEMLHFSDDKGGSGYHVLTNIYEYPLGALPRVTLQKDGLGQTIFQYSYATMISGINTCILTDGNGNQSTLQFNGNRLIQKTDALQHNSFYEYNDLNNQFNITKKTDENGHVTQFIYDSLGNLASMVDALNGTTTFTYDSTFSQPTSYSDPNLHATSLSLDSRGNPLTITDSLGHQIGLSYNNFGQMISKTDANGHVTQYNYDSFGNLTTIIDSLGHTTTLQFDSIGRNVSVTDPSTNTTQFVYDPADRMIRTNYADGTNRQFNYDNHSNRISFQDKNAKVDHYTFDVVDQLTQEQNHRGGALQFTYDSVGNRKNVTDSNSHITTYTYDALNRLATVTDATGKVQRNQYDNVGNHTLTIDGNNKSRILSYDALNRLTSDGPSSYTLDAVGNQTAISDGGITTTYNFDVANRLIGSVDSRGISFNYTYDSGSRKNSMQIIGANFNRTFSYTYFDDDRIKDITDPFGKSSYTYDPVGNILGVAQINGLFSSYSYNPKNYNLLSLFNRNAQNEVISFFKYTYDAESNRLTKQDLVGTTAYTYDADYELTDTLYSNGDAEHFVYDPMGNRQSRVFNAQTTAYAYNASNEIAHAGIVNFIHDGNGNQTAKGGISYVWDIKNRLTTVSYPAGSLVPTSTFKYDGTDRRIQKVDATGVVNYFYNGANNVLETDSNGMIKGIYNYGPAGLISKGDVTGNNSYFLYDGLGSVVNLTDAQGNILQRYDYESFGALRNTTKDSNNASRFVGAAGLKNDDDSGLVYMRARYYDSSIGRFVTRDRFTFGPDDTRLMELKQSLGLAKMIPSAIFNQDASGVAVSTIISPDIDQATEAYKKELINNVPQNQTNRYVYVGNNPINLTDPFGLFWGWLGGLLGSIGSALGSIGSALAGLAGSLFNWGSSLYNSIFGPFGSNQVSYQPWYPGNLPGGVITIHWCC